MPGPPRRPVNRHELRLPLLPGVVVRNSSVNDLDVPPAALPEQALGDLWIRLLLSDSVALTQLDTKTLKTFNGGS